MTTRTIGVLVAPAPTTLTQTAKRVEGIASSLTVTDNTTTSPTTTMLLMGV